MLKKLSLVLTLVLSFMVLVPASAQETVHIVHELVKRLYQRILKQL